MDEKNNFWMILYPELVQCWIDTAEDLKSVIEKDEYLQDREKNFITKFLREYKLFDSELSKIVEFTFDAMPFPHQITEGTLHKLIKSHVCGYIDSEIQEEINHKLFSVAHSAESSIDFIDDILDSHNYFVVGSLEEDYEVTVSDGTVDCFSRFLAKKKYVASWKTLKHFSPICDVETAKYFSDAAIEYFTLESYSFFNCNAKLNYLLTILIGSEHLSDKDRQCIASIRSNKSHKDICPDLTNSRRANIPLKEVAKEYLLNRDRICLLEKKIIDSGILGDAVDTWRNNLDKVSSSRNYTYELPFWSSYVGGPSIYILPTPIENAVYSEKIYFDTETVKHDKIPSPFIHNFYLAAFLDGGFEEPSLQVARNQIAKPVEIALSLLVDYAECKDPRDTEENIYNTNGRNAFCSIYEFLLDVNLHKLQGNNLCDLSEFNNAMDKWIYSAILKLVDEENLNDNGIAILLSFIAIESLVQGKDKQDSSTANLENRISCCFEPESILNGETIRKNLKVIKTNVKKLHDYRCKITHGTRGHEVVDQKVRKLAKNVAIAVLLKSIQYRNKYLAAEGLLAENILKSWHRDLDICYQDATQFSMQMEAEIEVGHTNTRSEHLSTIGLSRLIPDFTNV